jgi:NHL repeat.
VAGTGTPGFSGDDTPGASVSFSSPGDVALDAAGNIWVSDTGNNRIRKLTRDLSPSPIGQITALSVTHAATFKEQAIAPGEILSIFGSGMAPASASSRN